MPPPRAALPKRQATTPTPSQPQLEYNQKVYWMTPLGKALQEAIAEMNIRGDLGDQIIDKYEKAMEKQFEQLGEYSGKYHNSSRFKLLG